ncbi:DUF6755 family protein [Armatimonas sp.]|uniref:DUF6755 family protein n=1 Tax=Armatimonas sp. TaxID=1872638 RepID=UPI00286B481C|nr:DUF6755 family protein [Armatimonas sp.]
MKKRVWWQRRAQALVMLLCLVLALFLIQLWLITLALEDHLAEHSALAIPTFLASGGCFLVNLMLLRYIHDLDHRREEG